MEKRERESKETSPCAQQVLPEHTGIHREKRERERERVKKLHPAHNSYQSIFIERREPDQLHIALELK